MPFPFESLTVYQHALNVVENTTTLCSQINGKVPYPFLDQLTRAALSIPLNIAEGHGRWHKKEKIQFLRIAKGSIFEMVPIIQILYRKNILTKEEFEIHYSSLEILTKMMVNLIKSIDAPHE